MRFPLDLKHVSREWLPGLWLLAIFSAGFAPSVPAHAEVTSTAFARTLIEAVQGGGLTQTGLPDLDDKGRLYMIQFTSRVGDFQASGHFRIASPNVYVLPKTEQRWQTLPPDNTTGANIFFRKGPDLATLRYNEIQATAHTKDWVFTASMRRPPSEPEQEARGVILAHFGRLMQAARRAQVLPAVTSEVAYSGVKAPAILEWNKIWEDFSPQECAYAGATGAFDFLPGPWPTTDKYPWLRGYRSGTPEAHLKITCATAVTPQRTADELIDHSRREFVGLFVFASEEEAQDNFRQMIADRQWVWQWAPLRDAFEKDPELRSSISEELGSTAASGAGVQTVWKISPPTPVSEFWTANRRGKLRMGLTEEPFRSTAGSVEIGIERYKTVVMVTGAWAYAISQSRLEKTAITIPDDLVRFSYTNERHSHARQIVDERVRILRVTIQDSKPDTPEIDWPFDQPFTIRTRVEEWQQEGVAGPWKWAPPPKDRPIGVNLRLYPYGFQQPVSGCHVDFIRAYGSTTPIRLDAPWKKIEALRPFSDYYQTDPAGIVEINLLQGVEHGETIKSWGKEHVLDYERLVELMLEPAKQCSQGSARERPAPVDATAKAVAYRISADGRKIDYAEDDKRLWVGHVAELIGFGTTSASVKTRLRLQDHQGNPVPMAMNLKLLPNDQIVMGRADWIELAYPFLGRAWNIRATQALESGKEATLVIAPLRTAITDWGVVWQGAKAAGKEWGPTVLGVGAGVVIAVYFPPSAPAAPAEGAAIAAAATSKTAVIYKALIGAGVKAGITSLSTYAVEYVGPEYFEWTPLPDVRP